MKPTSLISVAIFSISAHLATVTLLAPNPATAQTLAQSRSECVRQTMYDAMGNIRRGMTAQAAAFACQNANPSNDVSQCVRQTMYDAMGNIRRGMTAEAAAFACQSANPSNDVSQCVRQAMYDAMGNIRRGMTAEAAAFACSNNRDVPGYVIILEP